MKKRLINIAILVLLCFVTEAQELEWSRFHSLNTDISKVTQVVYPKLNGNIILSPDIDLPSPQKTIDYHLNEYKLIDREITISEGKIITVLFSYVDDIIVSRVDISDTLYYSFDDGSQSYTSYRLSDSGARKLHSKIKHRDNYQVEEYTLYNNNGGRNQTQYTYDERGLLIKKNYYGKVAAVSDYHYDDNNRVVKETKVIGNKDYSVTTIIYAPKQVIRKQYVEDELFQIDTVDIRSSIVKITTYARVNKDGESELHQMKYERCDVNGNPEMMMDYLPRINQTEISKFIYTY